MVRLLLSALILSFLLAACDKLPDEQDATPLMDAAVSCGPGTHESAGACVPDDVPRCGEGTELQAGKCVALRPCPAGTIWSVQHMTCIEIPGPECGENTFERDGACVFEPSDDYCAAGTIFDPESRKCVRSDVCPAGQWPFGEECIVLEDDPGPDSPVQIDIGSRFAVAGTLEAGVEDRLEFEATSFSAAQITLFVRSGPHATFEVSSEEVPRYTRFPPQTTGIQSRQFVFPTDAEYYIAVDALEPTSDETSYLLLVEPIPGPEPRPLQGPGPEPTLDDLNSRFFHWTPNPSKIQHIQLAGSTSGFLSRGEPDGAWVVDSWYGGQDQAGIYFLGQESEEVFFFIDPVYPPSPSASFQMTVGSSDLVDDLILTTSEQELTLETEQGFTFNAPTDSVVYLRGTTHTGTPDGIHVPFVESSFSTSHVYRSHLTEANELLVIAGSSFTLDPVRAVYREIQHESLTAGERKVIKWDHYVRSEFDPWDPQPWPETVLRVELPPGSSQWSFPSWLVESGWPLYFQDVFWDENGILNPVAGWLGQTSTLVTTDSNHVFVELRLVLPDSFLEVEAFSTPTPVQEQPAQALSLSRSQPLLLELPVDRTISVPLDISSAGFLEFTSGDDDPHDSTASYRDVVWSDPNQVVDSWPGNLIVSAEQGGTTIEVEPAHLDSGDRALLSIQMPPVRAPRTLRSETILHLGTPGLRPLDVTPLAPGEEIWIASAQAFSLDGPPGASPYGGQFGTRITTAGSWEIENTRPAIVYRGTPRDASDDNSEPVLLGPQPVSLTGTFEDQFSDCLSIQIPALASDEYVAAYSLVEESRHSPIYQFYQPFSLRGPTPAYEQIVCAYGGKPGTRFLLLIEKNRTWLTD